MQTEDWKGNGGSKALSHQGRHEPNLSVIDSGMTRDLVAKSQGQNSRVQPLIVDE